MRNNRKKIYMQNREISWLRFNERVLEEAADTTVPLFERLKFISIFTKNLDEFFMIRVGSLCDTALIKPDYRDNKSGLTANEQLYRIYENVRLLYNKRTKIYNNVLNDLKKQCIYSLEFNELSKSEQEYIRSYYAANIETFLSPQIVDVHHPFPFIPNKTVFILAMLKRKNQEVMGLIPVPDMLPEIIYIPGNNIRFIKTEKVIYNFVYKIFKKFQITQKNYFCVTRNADIHFDESNFAISKDYRAGMLNLLHKRKKMCVVRLEAKFSMSSAVMQKFCEKLNITPSQIFVTNSELTMDYIFSLFKKLSSVQAKQLTYEPYIPVITDRVDSKKNLIEQIKNKDKLLFYPYESISTFFQLIKEAANDPKVISIKITIYRLSKNSKLVDYLCAAAENGKDVTAVMELRARFDEHNNIDWSEKLENSGCKVLYGLKDYKVHSKVCLITYMDKNNISYITQIGTGNYNENTAELYTDFAMMTGNYLIGKDASSLFENLSTGNIQGCYNLLLVAPSTLKPELMKLIEKEIEKGFDGIINIKINSLTDLDFINKFSEASRAGVKVNLIVRGICCLLPGVESFTDNISVTSIVGRYLEHSRIYSFGKGDSQVLYISSADLMTRNTERRIEVACPILDISIKQRINKIIEVILNDNIKARAMKSDGRYKKIFNDLRPTDSQLSFLQASSLETK